MLRERGVGKKRGYPVYEIFGGSERKKEERWTRQKLDGAKKTNQGGTPGKSLWGDLRRRKRGFSTKRELQQGRNWTKKELPRS